MDVLGLSPLSQVHHCSVLIGGMTTVGYPCQRVCMCAGSSSWAEIASPIQCQIFARRHGDHTLVLSYDRRGQAPKDGASSAFKASRRTLDPS